MGDSDDDSSLSGKDEMSIEADDMRMEPAHQIRAKAKSQNTMCWVITMTA